MADVPKDLLQEIKKLEEAFTIDTATLKKITDHFVSELEKGMNSCLRVITPQANPWPGLSVEGGSIVRRFPTGSLCFLLTDS